MRQISTRIFISLAVSLMIWSCGSGLGDGLYAEINTNKGTILIKLRYKEVPMTVANFISLAKGTNTELPDSLKGKPYYDGTIFHRVIKDFMIQGGNGPAVGKGPVGYTFKDEIVDSLKHDKKGVLSMANAGPSTNGSQFFIIQKPQPHLDGKHTVFGETLKGFEVIDSISNVKTSASDKPEQDVLVKSIKIIAEGDDAKNFNAARVFAQQMKISKDRDQEKMKKKEASKKNFLKKWEVQKDKAKKHPSGISMLTLEEPTGEKPKKGSFVMVDYAGYLTDGTLFDTSVEDLAEAYGIINSARKAAGGYKPFKVEYSKNARLIPGFVEALQTLKVGQKVRVYIPSNLGYGERGVGPIPPKSDLIFDIKLVKIAN